MVFEALKADVGRQVQTPRPRALGKSATEGPNDRLQADLIDFSQNTRGKTRYGLVAMDVFTRDAVEPLQNKNAETVGRATKRAAQELTGDDKNFVVTTDLGNEFATLDRELPEAVHRTKRPEDRNAIAVVDRGIQTLKKDLATRVAIASLTSLVAASIASLVTLGLVTLGLVAASIASLVTLGLVTLGLVSPASVPPPLPTSPASAPPPLPA